MEKVFTIRGVFKESFAIIKPKFWTVVGQFALIFLCYMVLSIGLKNIFIIRAIVDLLFMFTMTVFGLSYVKKGSFGFEDITEALKMKRFFYFIFAAVLFYLAAILGLILFIVPGIMVMVAMGFYKYLAIEKELSPIDALKESMRITKGYRWKIFWFTLLGGIIMVLGFVCLFVGSFFTIPLVLIADTLIYKKLSGTGSVEVEEVIIDVVEVEAMPA